MLSIIALVIMIVGMSLGFAAFSNTLTISSSAKVTPTDDVLKLVMYGFTGETEDDWLDLNKYTSTSFSKIMADEYELVFIDKTAEINNDSLSFNVSDIEFENPNEFFITSFLVVNDGSYDVYFDTSYFENYEYVGTCTPGNGASPNLVEAACLNVIRGLSQMHHGRVFEAKKEYEEGKIEQKDLDLIVEQDCFSQMNGVCKLAKGEKVFILFAIGYEQEFDNEGNDITPRADGPFSVTFPDMKLEFTTDSTGYVGE